MEIGKRLKKAREAIGYTQKKAADESGIGESSLSEFENSKREPKFYQLSKLAQVYRKSVDFFFADTLPAEDMMLWRAKPEEQLVGQTESEFRQLCRQYHSLEVCMDQAQKIVLPQSTVTRPEDFDYKQASRFAEKVQRDFLLGDVPSTSLKQILEERYYIKIFHLSFQGSAISTLSQDFGYAILLNKDNKQWRRNFDLAHELFHILTWNIFRSQSCEHGDREDKLANAFASRLLLPTDSVKNKIDSALNDKKSISLEALDEIAREFGVSLDALLWRMVYLYNKSEEDIEKDIEKSKELKISRPERISDTPDELPERYCSLAIKALNEGKISLMQFAKYMRITYRQAQDYLAKGEDFTDEKISISVA
jgi:Zn-dependent peptidase ImmA (M78 family)/DNA-binding XRE family transcriptional regulator